MQLFWKILTDIQKIFPAPNYMSTRINAMTLFNTIGTHNGVFHCDEVLGCYMLKLLSPHANIIRSRSPEDLAACDIVIDVGAEFNPAKRRFDHHQRDFNHSMSSLIPGKKWKMKLSSAGLVYCHYGKDIIKAVLKGSDLDDIDAIYDKVYEDFIQEIDGIDNGVPMFSEEPLYRITTNLSARVANLNSNWTQTKFDETGAFSTAMELVGKEFEEKIHFAVNVWWPARSIISSALENRFETHKSGEIIYLEKFCPWEEHLFTLEQVMEVNPTVKFLIFPNVTGGWRVRSVPVSRGSFVLRVPLNKDWQGLNEEELSSVADIKDCVFAHSSGFIGGNKTKAGAIQMAKKSLELALA